MPFFRMLALGRMTWLLLSRSITPHSQLGRKLRQQFLQHRAPIWLYLHQMRSTRPPSPRSVFSPLEVHALLLLRPPNTGLNPKEGQNQCCLQRSRGRDRRSGESCRPPGGDIAIVASWPGKWCFMLLLRFLWGTSSPITSCCAITQP
ncbi:hypothetical protein BKA70DRAFT_1294827, partial [Coprinopsis sp. MPI-PUGE-AT-0042]